jgi:2-keto-4-pentenoate hydratase/2-oxohepta-3-ene-1,7-dioic acid hydratase in catechol pathway
VRLASYSLGGEPPRPGLVLGDEILDLSDPAAGLPPSMVDLLALGSEGLERVAAAATGSAARHPLDAVRRHAPVPGFTIINDASTRDWQWRTPTFMMGKSFDTHAPCGPELVTGDELGDPGSLAIRTWVNDELRQDSSTADLIFGCADMIEYLTTAFPLEPGTVIATGTPAGVGAGFDPPRFLAAGDTVRISIEGIGELSNPVVQGGLPEPVGLA